MRIEFTLKVPIYNYMYLSVGVHCTNPVSHWAEPRSFGQICGTWRQLCGHCQYIQLGPIRNYNWKLVCKDVSSLLTFEPTLEGMVCFTLIVQDYFETVHWLILPVQVSLLNPAKIVVVFVVVVICGLTSHSAIFQLYSDGTDVQFPNFDLLPGTHAIGS